MAMTVGDFFIDRLYQWGVRRIYGYPGDGINGVFGALQRAEGKIEFIQVRHEEMAAFMASAHAKFTGELGVCIATSGPGAAHMVTGLYDARLDHMPLLAITGQQARMALGGHYQQEVDLPAMFKDVAGAFVHTATMPAQVRHMTDRAVRIATARRRVTAMVFLMTCKSSNTRSRRGRTAHCIQGSAINHPRWCRTIRSCARQPRC
jgi:pyruvate dehydrogenase (quinone)